MKPEGITLLVEIESKDLGMLDLGGGELAQAVLVSVRDKHRDSRHAVVTEAPGDASAVSLRREKIAARLPDRLISMLVSRKEGEIHMVPGPADESLLLAAAAAAATVNRSWSWDESPAIVVTIVGPVGMQLVLDPVFVDGTWTVRFAG